MYWGAVGLRPPAPRGKERGITSPSTDRLSRLLSPTKQESTHGQTLERARKSTKLPNVAERADHRLTPRTLSGMCHCRPPTVGSGYRRSITDDPQASLDK